MANGGFSFNLDGLEATVTALDKFVEEFDERIDATLTRLALKIIADAKHLAPIDYGDLEAALVVDEVKQMIGASSIAFGASPEVDHYAPLQHEGFYERADGKLITFTPGEKTLSKGPYNGYMPGKKFLENALKMNEQLIIDELSKLLK